MIYLLIQSLLIKRPYNLFHRKNLLMRTKNVKRNFGNKKSWDTSFINHMIKFKNELIKLYKIKEKCKESEIYNLSYDNIPTDIIDSIDTIYIDPPYFKKNKESNDYINYYHFLEGLMNYDEWKNYIDILSINKNFNNETKKKYIIKDAKVMFETIINKYKNKNLIISYMDCGYPTNTDLENLFKQHFKTVITEQIPYKYALSKKKSNEVLYILKN